MRDIVELNPQERFERIKLSKLAERISFLKTPQGLDWFLKTEEYTQDEKDYVLFNISQLKQISKMRWAEFRENVENFKNGVVNV